MAKKTDFIKKVLSEIICKICSLFYYRFKLLAFLFLLIVIPDIIEAFLENNIKLVIYILLHGFFVSYIIVAIYVILPSIFKKVFLFLLLGILSLLFSVSVFCLFMYQCGLNESIVSIIVATNKNEAFEFLNIYHESIYCMVLMGVFVIIGFIFLYLREPVMTEKKIYRSVFFEYILVFVLITGCILSVKNLKLWNNELIGKIFLFNSLKTVSLRDYQKSIPLLLDDDLPARVVVIMGESFSKDHSSLYGYIKQTNPHLMKLINRGDLFVYSDVVSPAISTIESFRRMMSSYSFDSTGKWYENIFLSNILSSAGYKTYWISNQSKSGLYDNGVTCFSEIFDDIFFVDNKPFIQNMKYQDEGQLDEVLIETIDEKKCKDEKQFYFVHLIGSHIDYKKRYSSHFSKFSMNDYSDHGFEYDQKEKIAAYDNSILYNDSVVNEIIKRFKDEVSIVFYLSDHGQDIYYSSKDYAGHAKQSGKSIWAAARIPFLIYVSPNFKEKYPDTVARIKVSTNHPFMTDDLMYTVMDILNINFKDDQDVVSQKSILNPNLNRKRLVEGRGGHLFDYDKKRFVN